MYNREEVLEALHNKNNKVTPVSFWRHFAPDEFVDALSEPSVVQTNIEGLRKYVQDVHPDFVKLMTDGYFQYPMLKVADIHDSSSLQQLENLPEDHPWLTGQAELVKKQIAVVEGRVTFYNVFSPLTVLKWALIGYHSADLAQADRLLADLYEQDPDGLKEVLLKIGADVKKQIKIATDNGADGIYYSTQSIQDSRTDNKTFFKEIQEVVDLDVIEQINSCSDLNILHICGFAGATNHLEWFKDYPLQIINWATHVDKCSLSEGKKLFAGKVVLGGFGNTDEDILYAGTKQQIQEEVKRIIEDAGKEGVIIGADCTILRDTPVEHLLWAEDATHTL
ncbi:MAG: uroporphyrinogen decarboxylase family protein [Sporolactobacillus sp.]